MSDFSASSLCRVTWWDMGSREHIKAGGLQSEKQLPFEIFQRPPSALLLALMFFRWRWDFKMLDYREKNVEDNAISPPASFPHLLKGLILQVLPRQNCSGEKMFSKTAPRWAVSAEQSAPVCVALGSSSSGQRLSTETCFS